MNDITMTLSSPEVTLVEGKGSLTVSVTNASTASQRIVLGAFPLATGDAGATDAEAPAVAPIATVDRPLRTVAAGATEQYTVSFDVSASAPGDHVVRLIGYSADRAPEEYADQAQTVTLTVAGKPVPVPVKKFPWWIVIVAAVVLVGVAIAGVIFVVTQVDQPPTGTPTQAVRPPDIIDPTSRPQKVLGGGSYIQFSTTVPATDSGGRPYLLHVDVTPSDASTGRHSMDIALGDISPGTSPATDSSISVERILFTLEKRALITVFVRGTGEVALALEAPDGAMSTWIGKF